MLQRTLLRQFVLFLVSRHIVAVFVLLSVLTRLIRSTLSKRGLFLRTEPASILANTELFFENGRVNIILPPISVDISLFVLQSSTPKERNTPAFCFLMRAVCIHIAQVDAAVFYDETKGETVSIRMVSFQGDETGASLHSKSIALCFPFLEPKPEWFIDTVELKCSHINIQTESQEETVKIFLHSTQLYTSIREHEYENKPRLFCFIGTGFKRKTKVFSVEKTRIECSYKHREETLYETIQKEKTHLCSLKGRYLHVDTRSSKATSQIPFLFPTHFLIRQVQNTVLRFKKIFDHQPGDNETVFITSVFDEFFFSIRENTFRQRLDRIYARENIDRRRRMEEKHSDTLFGEYKKAFSRCKKNETLFSLKTNAEVAITVLESIPKEKTALILNKLSGRRSKWNTNTVEELFFVLGMKIKTKLNKTEATLGKKNRARAEHTETNSLLFLTEEHAQEKTSEEILFSFTKNSAKYSATRSLLPVRATLSLEASTTEAALDISSPLEPALTEMFFLVDHLLPNDPLSKNKSPFEKLNTVLCWKDCTLLAASLAVSLRLDSRDTLELSMQNTTATVSNKKELTLSLLTENTSVGLSPAKNSRLKFLLEKTAPLENRKWTVLRTEKTNTKIVLNEKRHTLAHNKHTTHFHCKVFVSLPEKVLFFFSTRLGEVLGDTGKTLLGHCGKGCLLSLGDVCRVSRYRASVLVRANAFDVSFVVLPFTDRSVLCVSGEKLRASLSTDSNKQPECVSVRATSFSLRITDSDGTHAGKENPVSVEHAFFFHTRNSHCGNKNVLREIALLRKEFEKEASRGAVSLKTARGLKHKTDVLACLTEKYLRENTLGTEILFHYLRADLDENILGSLKSLVLLATGMALAERVLDSNKKESEVLRKVDFVFYRPNFFMKNECVLVSPEELLFALRLDSPENETICITCLGCEAFDQTASILGGEKVFHRKEKRMVEPFSFTVLHSVAPETENIDIELTALCMKLSREQLASVAAVASIVAAFPIDSHSLQTAKKIKHGGIVLDEKIARLKGKRKHRKEPATLEKLVELLLVRKFVRTKKKDIKTRFCLEKICLKLVGAENEVFASLVGDSLTVFARENNSLSVSVSLEELLVRDTAGSKNVLTQRAKDDYALKVVFQKKDPLYLPDEIEKLEISLGSFFADIEQSLVNKVSKYFAEQEGKRPVQKPKNIFVARVHLPRAEHVVCYKLGKTTYLKNFRFVLNEQLYVDQKKTWSGLVRKIKKKIVFMAISQGGSMLKKKIFW
ncbi:MAG: uncharacterized protein A8A55_0931 [Amphiamblys sp. WSBS2006]|nr:MAG: uncharacterized protein A8A55_0931 [Amphiamblys sp. WSBS2006]